LRCGIGAPNRHIAIQPQDTTFVGIGGALRPSTEVLANMKIGTA
jgi:hypothetical protein